MKRISEERAMNLLTFAEFALRAVQSKVALDPREPILNAGNILGIYKLDDTKGEYYITSEEEQPTPQDAL